MKQKKGNIISYAAVFMLFSMAFFSRCAQTAAPQGGPRDTIPPILLEVTPANNTTNFDAKQVEFKFNEYLQLKDVSKEILISPPMSPRPTFTVKGKGFVMKFPPELVLDSNTTYRVDFGGSITDNNEGNPAKRFEYVFSTGNNIDSLVMTGQLIDATTSEPIIRGLAYFFANEVITSDTLAGDSTLYIGKPLAVARTDSSGNFLATNLVNMDYRIFGIKDENSNGTYDIGEDLVGLSNKTYNPTKLEPFKVWIDPVIDRIEVTSQMRLSLFSEEKRLPQRLSEVTRTKEYMLQLIFARDSANIVGIDIDSLTKENIIIENSRMDDSVRVWIMPIGEEFSMPDTLVGSVRYYKTGDNGQMVLDTTEFALSFFKQEERKDGVGAKVTESFDNFFKKFTDWLERVFMGRKKKMALAILRERALVADSLKKITADSLALINQRDSLAKLDSIRLVAIQDSITRAESGLPPITKKDSLDKLTASFSLSGDVSPESVLYLSSEYPMVIDTSKFKIERLSYQERSEDFFDEELSSQVEETPTIKSVQPYTLHRDSLDMTRWRIDIAWEPKSEYNITLHNDALMNMIGQVNDSTTTVIKTLDPSENGTVVVDVKLFDSLSNRSYVINLMDSTNNIVQSKPSIGSGEIRFNYVVPKKYKLMFVNDTNSNGKQDMGILIENKEPESIEIYYIKPEEPLFKVEKDKEVRIEVYPETLFDKSLLTKITPKKEEESVTSVQKDEK